MGGETDHDALGERGGTTRTRVHGKAARVGVRAGDFGIPGRIDAEQLVAGDVGLEPRDIRGGFTAVFFVQCLVAIGCQSIRIFDG